MKKGAIYLLVGLIVAAIIAMILFERKTNRQLNEQVTLRKRDKIPYGTYVAHRSLSQMFPHASIVTSRQEPGTWDSVSANASGQAVIIICPEFSADKYEMRNLVEFVEGGNDVFISTMELSYEATGMLNCSVNTISHLVSYFSTGDDMDTLTVSLAEPPYQQGGAYTYPGKQYDGYFSRLDTGTTSVLGYDHDHRPNFIHLKAGEGNLYVHLAPMAFTNYFLLHKSNFAYYEKALSVVSPSVRSVVWDEYYLYKKGNSDNRKKNWLSVLWNTRNAAGQKPFASALSLLIVLLIMYVLIEMRRKQRLIPVVRRPQNDSLEFVKTIGRLYHDKADHINLCRKMSAYFLEHVRNRYKLVTTNLDEAFVQNLHNKTGIDRNEIAAITEEIKQLDSNSMVLPEQLVRFHKQLESFYKKE